MTIKDMAWNSVKWKFWKIISISGVLLLCTDTYGSTVNPNMQFLEIVNYSQEKARIKIAYANTGDPRWQEEIITVAPGKRGRFPSSLKPGYPVYLGRLEEPYFVTEGFQLNNYGTKTFLHGKQLTIGKRGDHNVKSVRFLHGLWRIKKKKKKKRVAGVGTESLSCTPTIFR